MAHQAKSIGKVVLKVQSTLPQKTFFGLKQHFYDKTNSQIVFEALRQLWLNTKLERNERLLKMVYLHRGNPNN